MQRDRIKTTREDATGFENGPKDPRKESILKPLDQGAVASFAKRKRVTKTADEQPVTPPDQPKSKGDHPDSDAAVGLTETQGLDVQPAADEAGDG